MEAVDREVRVAMTTLMTSMILFSVRNPHHRLSCQRQIARQVGISISSVNKIIHKDLRAQMSRSVKRMS